MAGRASATLAALERARAATPAARRTASGSTWSAGPSPTTTSSGALIVPPVGILATSPRLPVKPRVESSGPNFRPYAEATSSAPAAATTPLPAVTTPITTASVRVLAGEPLRRVKEVTARC